MIGWMKSYRMGWDEVGRSWIGCDRMDEIIWVGYYGGILWWDRVGYM